MSKASRFLSFIITLPLVSASLLLLNSCDNFLEVDPPTSQLNSGNVFDEKATANAAMSDIYSKMRDAGLLTGYSSGISQMLGLYTDEMILYGSGEDLQLAYDNSLLASTNTIKTLWNDTYSQIYSANALIAGVDGSQMLPDGDKRQLKGEALFVRALLHFHMANIYGPIPYVKTMDYLVNSQVTRITEAEVFEECSADLEQAIVLLPQEYISGERTRPNSFAAHALLSRIALYAGQYEIASNEASAVLNQTGLYVFENNLENTFLKESHATIWQFSPGYDGANSIEATTFVFETGPPPVSALSEDLLNAFPTGDLRRANWIREISDGNSSWFHPYKYKVVSGSPAIEYSIVLRLSEVYLIRAEARARMGELTGAREDLDVIRLAAGIGPSLATTQQGLLEDILLQRRLELFSEFGHRFFDLKRFGAIDSTLSAQKPGWNATDALWPIPQNELLLNPSLAPQNTGY